MASQVLGSMSTYKYNDIPVTTVVYAPDVPSVVNVVVNVGGGGHKVVLCC